jgi:hypothetical protein
MSKYKSFFYIIDKLDDQKAQLLKKSLIILPEVYDVIPRTNKGYIEVKAGKNMISQVRMACDIAEVKFRTEASEKDILYY